jgi:hypothetical protein
VSPAETTVHHHIDIHSEPVVTVGLHTIRGEDIKGEK